MKVGDIVWVSNPDVEYEKEYGYRAHAYFFGKVTEISGNCVNVDFNNQDEWCYCAEELSLASTLKDMTLEEFSNRFGLAVNGVYLCYADTNGEHKGDVTNE